MPSFMRRLSYGNLPMMRYVVELIVEMLDKMVHGVMGKSGDKFVNYIGTIFIFILFSNISGLK